MGKKVSSRFLCVYINLKKIAAVAFVWCCLCQLIRNILGGSILALFLYPTHHSWSREFFMISKRFKYFLAFMQIFPGKSAQVSPSPKKNLSFTTMWNQTPWKNPKFLVRVKIFSNMIRKSSLLFLPFDAYENRPRGSKKLSSFSTSTFTWNFHSHVYMSFIVLWTI